MDITDEDIENLCVSMKKTALKNCRNDEERALVKDVTVKQLFTWGILQENEGKYAATNAFALLTGNEILPTAIQCGVLKGTTKSVLWIVESIRGDSEPGGRGLAVCASK